VTGVQTCALPISLYAVIPRRTKQGKTRALEMQGREGQQSLGCQNTWGREAKRTQMLGMACSTLRLSPQRGAPACSQNGRILLANPKVPKIVPRTCCHLWRTNMGSHKSNHTHVART